ncbi:MAG: UDP-N-acetylmuramoyl-tripeptide--D-alanyl-D-alanine ligase [bacterium]
MNNITVKDLIRIMKGNLIIGDPRLPVKRISINTRTMERGDFFLALRGKHYDGHDFLPVTLEKGAAGLIISRLSKDFGKNPINYRQFPTIIQVDNPLEALQNFAKAYRKQFVALVIGITGSNGKTTTKEILSTILGQFDRCLYNQGNYNNHIGLPLTLLNLEQDHRFVIVEMGASAMGDIKKLAVIAEPKIGIITNIAPAHLETFGGIKNIFKTKMELLYSLPEDGEAIVNEDDPWLRELDKELRCRVTTYGLRSSSDVYVENPIFWPNASFQMMIQGTPYQVNLMYGGQYNVYNALAAAAAAWRIGIAPEAIADRLNKSSLPPMRNEVLITKTNGVLVNDAYNANPLSMRASLECFVKSYPGKKKIAVLGDMLELGSYAVEEHKNLGKFLASLPLDLIMLFGEYRYHICDAARKEGVASNKLRCYDIRSYIIEDLVRMVNASSAVLFKASHSMGFDKIADQVYKGIK